MKHYFPLFVCLILCVCLLCGCGCKHEWSEAACEQPKTCSACGLTEGEALGHSWLDATCTAPRTCSACGAEEGEALGHNWFDATCTAPETCGICGATQGAALNHAFGSWNILEDNMVHSCAYCALEESRPVDYQFLLEQELPGIWTLSLVVDTNDRVHDVKNILKKGYAPSVVYLPDGGCGLLTVDGLEEWEEKWSFYSYDTDPDNGITYILFAQIAPDGSITALNSTMTITEEDVSLCVLMEDGIYIYDKHIGDGLSTMINGTWSAYSCGEIYNLTLNEDRSFTADWDSDLHGYWQPLNIETDYGNTVPIRLVYEKDGSKEAFRMELEGFSMPLAGRTQDKTMLTLHSQTTINDEYPSFSHGSADRIKEILENSGTEILGSWTSLDLRYSYNDGRYEEIPTNEYSIEIRDDGTFRAVLGSEITGSWELGEISFYSGGASHSYSLTSEAWPNGATLSLSGSSIRLQIRFDDRYEYYTFAMLSEEELAQFAELEKTGPTMIVGEWTSVLVQNSTADNNYTLSNATGYSVTFSEDGTFSGYLSRDISGTWEYAGISPNTDYNGSGMVCDYHLRFDGESNTPYTVSIANGKLDIFLRNEEAGAYNCHDLYKWSAEELKQFEAERKSLVGTWNFKGAYTYDSSTDSQIDYDAGSCSLELSEDGSFSAVLGSSCSGTWAYAGMENNCPTVQLSFTDTTGYWPIPIVDGVLELWREISDQYIGFAFEK